MKQTLDLVAVGCQLVRITAPTVKDAANLQNIVAELHKRGCYVPIVADIHFKPEAAMEAVKWVEVVRVNPGNYADSKKFATKEYTDEQYTAELKRIEEKFTPLVLECIRLKRCLRIGTNHGSLSDRIMNRYGDTPLGMVESALEFARICRQHNFHNFKFSMKSSNPKVMIECYRLLVARLEQEGPDWNYPDSSRRHRSGRGRGWPHQERHRHRFAVVRRFGRHDSRLAHGGFSRVKSRFAPICWRRFPSYTLNSESVHIGSGLSRHSEPFPLIRSISSAAKRRKLNWPTASNAAANNSFASLLPAPHGTRSRPKIRPKDDVKPEAVYEDLNIAEIDPTKRFRTSIVTHNSSQ